jgi:hypothetical protein
VEAFDQTIDDHFIRVDCTPCLRICLAKFVASGSGSQPLSNFPCFRLLDGLLPGKTDVSVSCVGFDLTIKWTVDVHETWFFDKDGFPKSAHLQFRGDVEITRDGFPENTLYGRRADNQIGDFSNGFTGFVINGGFIKVNLPGYGPLYFDAGRVEFDSDFNITRVRGMHHDHLLDQTDALCRYFQ